MFLLVSGKGTISISDELNTVIEFDEYICQDLNFLICDIFSCLVCMYCVRLPCYIVV